MNNLDQAPLMLLVGHGEAETMEELFAVMKSQYDPRLEDKEFGATYKLGPTYMYAGQRFSQICTFAGSLVIRIVFDTRQRRFTRQVIYRFDPNDSLRLLTPGGPESVIEESELKDETSC